MDCRGWSATSVLNATERPSRSRRRVFDVVVVGGGPAGAVMGWALASRGMRVLILDRARFPREKVCGDFVEPRGLRLFQAMGCLDALEADDPLAITHVNLFLNGRSAYREHIPFYAGQSELPQHGYIIPRETLDHRILAAAVAAGAELREGCQVSGVVRDGDRMVVRYADGDTAAAVRASLVVGADGTHSIVARSFDMLADDPRYMAVSQRAYVEGVEMTHGEAAFVFDRELFPGYGWLFPMSNGRANAGVGILAETRDRDRISVPKLFDAFLRKLRRQHPGCGALRLASKPIGGIVKTYGGHGRNRFDGGILIGDAGSFVDPITGEGITPAAESALIGADVIVDALEQGRSDAAYLSAYERRFRAYFDPAMCYLDFVACVMRNRHFCDFWLSVVTQGCELAMQDRTFARTGGAGFGGLDIRPLDMVGRMWAKSLGRLAVQGGRIATGLFTGRIGAVPAIADMARWQTGWWASLADDPAWHARWMADVAGKWLRLSRTVRMRDPRARGPAQLRLTASR
ncbi:MAG: NAD(P)/FAD-dependent oxidoreductase [Gemmatimonadota bacterium]